MFVAITLQMNVLRRRWLARLQYDALLLDFSRRFVKIVG